MIRSNIQFLLEIASMYFAKCLIRFITNSLIRGLADIAGGLFFFYFWLIIISFRSWHIAKIRMFRQPVKLYCSFEQNEALLEEVEYSIFLEV